MIHVNDLPKLEMADECPICGCDKISSGCRNLLHFRCGSSVLGLKVLLSCEKKEEENTAG